MAGFHISKHAPPLTRSFTSGLGVQVIALWQKPDENGAASPALANDVAPIEGAGGCGSPINR